MFDFKKIQFYTGRTGEEPFEILCLCYSAHLVLMSVSIISSNFKNIYFRILFEIILLGLLMFLIIYKNSLFILLFYIPIFLRKKKPFVPNQRSYPLTLTKLTLLFLTLVCIIFVDFPWFPTNIAKVSNHIYNWNGTLIVGDLLKFEDNYNPKHVTISLMDVGAAVFVVLNGFASQTFSKCLKSGTINVLLYFTRVILTKSVDYYSPESEYGKYCNFFGYIGSIQLIASFAALLKIPTSVLSIVTLLVHEISNFKYPFLGYVSLYFISFFMGFKMKEKYNLISQVILFTIYLMPVILSSCEIIFPSRASVDTSFILFILFIIYSSLLVGNNYQINYYELSPFYMLIDQNSLAFFAFANIITGIINILIDANHSSKLVAFISVYITFIGSCALTFLYDAINRKLLKKPSIFQSIK